MISHQKCILEWCAHFGWPTQLNTDGASVFCCPLIEQWLKDKKIKHRLSSATFAQSNGLIEQRIKLYKNLCFKIEAEGKPRPDLQVIERFQAAMDFPSKPGKLSPSRMAFRRLRRYPGFPRLQRLVLHPDRQGAGGQRVRDGVGVEAEEEEMDVEATSASQNQVGDEEIGAGGQRV